MKWDTQLYDDKHAFVSKYGEDVIKLLAPVTGERILDIGCGTAHLTNEIASTGAHVTGLDASPDMIAAAKSAYPDIHFVTASAASFTVGDLGADQPFDAIFSNAALHWVHAAEAAIVCMANALRSDGRFVVEFGGHGNVQQILSALTQAMHDIAGVSNIAVTNYFPSIAQYSTLLEKHSIEVVTAILFDRPTPLDGGDAGLANWVRMFRGDVVKPLAADTQSAVFAAMEKQLRPHLFRDGTWYADYRRLRLVAYKRTV